MHFYSKLGRKRRGEEALQLLRLLTEQALRLLMLELLRYHLQELMEHVLG